MRIRKWMHAIAVATLVGASAATPAWAGGNSASMQSGDNALTTDDTAVRTYGDTGTTMSYDHGTATIQSDDTGSIQSWADDTAATGGGVIREEDFLDEMGRRFDANPNHTGMRSLYIDDLRARWEAVDPGNQGLTPSQVSELTGNVDSSAGPSLSGSDAQPGNMGPGNMKGQ